MLLDEGLSRLSIGLQCLCLPARAIEGEDQLLSEAFAQRVLGDECLQLADNLGVPAELELGLDPLLERAEPQLLEAGDLALRKGLVGQVAESGPAPERERLAEGCCRGSGPVFASLGAERLEAP